MSDLTVLLTVWRRPYLARQLTALAVQTLRPAAIWIYHCANHVDPRPEIATIRDVPVNYVHSDDDLGYFGRFAIAPFVDTRYVTIIDDDLLPGREWLAHARATSQAHGAVVCTAGMALPRHCLDVRTARAVGANGRCPADTPVDFGCNSWLLEAEWARRFWTVPPAHLRNAEDLHFGVAMAEHGIATVVPAQTSAERSGNAEPALGIDEAASWRRVGYDDERMATLSYMLARGWRPLADRAAAAR